MEENLIHNIDLSKVYIKINDNNEIIEINSDEFIDNITNWIYIDEGNGDKYRLAQQHYLEKKLVNENGAYNYKYENGKIIEVENNVIPTISYEQLVENKIRLRYTISDELALLRQRDVKQDEFNEYYNYCELCKQQARQELNM